MLKAWICHYVLDSVLFVECFATRQEAERRASIVDGVVVYDLYNAR